MADHLNATDALATGQSLQFSRSAHQQLGMGKGWMANIQDNAPALVGAMRLGAALLPVAAGVLGWDDPDVLKEALPFLSIHGAGLVGSELILLANGSKEKRQQAAKEYAGVPEEPDWRKPLNPKRYPLESSAALDVVGESAMVLGGALMLFGIMPDWLESALGIHEHGAEMADCVEHETEALPSFSSFTPPAFDGAHDHVHCDTANDELHNHAGGFAVLAHGAVGLLAHLPIIFGKEGAHTHAFSEHSKAADDKKDSLTFAKSTSKKVGVVGRAFEGLKDNPIAVASALQAAVGVSLILAFPASWSLMASGAIITASAVLQGLFVRKNLDNQLPQPHVQDAQLEDILNKGPAPSLG